MLLCFPDGNVALHKVGARASLIIACPERQRKLAPAPRPRPQAQPVQRARTLTSRSWYTFSLFGALLCLLLLRPPATRSIPCAREADTARQNSGPAAHGAWERRKLFGRLSRRARAGRGASSLRHEVSSGSKVRGAGRGGETTDHVATGRRCLGAASGSDGPIEGIFSRPLGCVCGLSIGKKWFAV